jgi:MFS family permease
MNAGNEIGFYSGLFFSIFQVNIMFGNLIAGSLLALGLGQFWTLFVLFLIGLFGNVLFIYLIPIKKRSERAKTEAEPAPSLRETIKQTLLILIDKKMLLFFSTIAYSGYTQSFFYGIIPPIVGEKNVGWTMAAYGAFEIVGSLVFGKIVDTFGRRYSTILSFIVHAAALTSTFFITKAQPYMFYVTTSLCGLADASLNTSVYSVLGYVFLDRATYAFAAYLNVQSLLTAAGFFSGLYLEFLHVQIITIVLLVMAVITFIILDFFVARVDEKKE